MGIKCEMGRETVDEAEVTIFYKDIQKIPFIDHPNKE